MEKHELAGYIDHTLLRGGTTKRQIRLLCLEAKEYGFRSVCVNSCWTSFCSEFLGDTDIATCVVVGFPLGAMETMSKAYEARRAVELGAREIDMVMNIGAFKSNDSNLVRDDIATVVDAAGDAGVKVIIEACLLTDAEKINACLMARDVGASFVKTSTGFSEHGATVRDVRLMRKTVGTDMGVKAAGGVRTAEDVIAMIEAGATRIGTSVGVSIIEGEKLPSSY
ncbi:Deoxyribose-phosphate aldolase [Olavius algarvensis spirochete endosymbiont]|uniref:deoxyribose-phosphate aldolase n=1 Tax=Olavius algarvensis spirochete endosymbiont TaxID=260710 RepID=UPI000F24ED1B|nr:deoxyribose-phosphate aldolase [Olavius algarvensis spirochete endosymbiont]VDA99506.1 Deoxyribose-phosphate aldolase [Olavius algarvensis spirochete endosymbiont]